MSPYVTGDEVITRKEIFLRDRWFVQVITKFCARQNINRRKILRNTIVSCFVYAFDTQRELCCKRKKHGFLYKSLNEGNVIIVHILLSTIVKDISSSV